MLDLLTFYFPKFNGASQRLLERERNRAEGGKDDNSVGIQYKDDNFLFTTDSKNANFRIKANISSILNP
jgi:hypothetical protein